VELATESNGTQPEPTVEVKTRKTRRSPSDEQVAEMKRLRTEGVTFSEVARQTGFSVGTIQKMVGPAKEKTPGKKRGPKPKAAAVSSSTSVDTPTAVKAAMADLLLAGHPLAGIRGALASLNLGGH
jgi:hypothetical protein